MASNSYPAVHQRLRRQRGKATEHACAGCGDPASHWAYDKSDAEPITAVVQGKRVTYSADLDRYQPLCLPCHRALDQPPRTRCKRDHELSGDNVYVRPSDGSRLCRACKNVTLQLWRSEHPDYRRKVPA